MAPGKAKSRGGRPWVGLDVGSFSVKLLAGAHGPLDQRFRHGEALVAAADGSDGPPTAEGVARAIGDCFEQAEIALRNVRGVTLGISGPELVVKQITLPMLTDDEVGPALRFEARKHLPFDLQSMVIDYQILGRFLSEKKLDVLIAAISQDRLDKHLAPLKLLGIDPQIVDATPLALTNALRHELEDGRDACVQLDIGHLASHLTIWQKGEPYFSRRLDFGGRMLSEAIRERGAIPFEEAEEWKLAAGAERPGFRADWHSPEMQAMLDCIRRDLVDEVRRSLAFYRTMGRLPEPLRLWISGGSARLPGLAARLAELLGIPVHLFNPFHANGGPADESHPTGAGPQFAQALGLALRTT